MNIKKQISLFFTKRNLIILGILFIAWIGVINFGENIDFIDGEKPKDMEHFVSDGCSMFPDGDYLDCCIEHDKAYFFGGTWEQRMKADEDFYYCIEEKGELHHKILAPSMYVGVRAGGAPIYPTPYRWGYGRDLISE